MTPFASCVIVAAGRGQRFGNASKIIADVGGRPVLAWVLDAMERAVTVRDVVVVYGPHTEPAIRALVESGRWPKVTALVPGGAQRQDSMRNGLLATADDLDVVLVHDAARPMIAPPIVDICAERARDVGAAIVATPVTDTIKDVDGSRIRTTIDRRRLWAAQTPQGFRRALLLDLCDRAISHGIEVTDEAALAEALNVPVEIVSGDRLNLKITVPEDVQMIDAILRSQEETPRMTTRTGLGYDVHQFADDRRMVLGGVDIPHERGLLGHSDADVLLHAMADALLGAGALGDIGTHFPPSDPQWKDMDSAEILRHAVALLREHGWQPVNIDATVIAESPKINPHVPTMREGIAAMTGLTVNDISIKATTNEGMGFVGRQEGIAALAIATIGQRVSA